MAAFLFYKEFIIMHCPMKFEWVKLLRSRLPEGKGIMGAWAKLAARAAFRKGQAHYCGYTNEVVPGCGREELSD